MTTQPEQQTTAPEVPLPEPVAYRSAVPDNNSGWTYAGDFRTEENPREQALVTQPDALAYADARAARAVEQERARVVAWLRRDLWDNGQATREARLFRKAAYAIEAGDHLG